jgi:hypothetical protein
LEITAIIYIVVNKMLRKNTGPKRECFISHALRHTNYFQSNQMKEGEMGDNESLMREGQNAHKIFVGESDRKRSYGRRRRRWEDNIKMQIKTIQFLG